jgi:Sugar transferases involved in lipopolysaccharide synthesis
MYKAFKRSADIVLSLVGILFLSPVLLVIAIAARKDTGGSALFKQDRIGKNKKLFKCYKFRTMSVTAPANVPTHLLENPAAYITRLGGFMRKTSLDELPQIFNILKGDMSVVGPRPALYNQDDLVAEREKYGANDIRPGLTGLAQISGRDELDIPLKAKIDGYYTEHMGFALDVKIFFKTILKVLKRDGIKEGKSASSAENKDV